ncbi:anthrone oxygenase family protein [Thermobifida cellulosilytica]|uniref:DUF1772 domain-containing protein n=1 Tax=Thermobifida cellulosilytica TB100 TaxID=665004 RepID=A0A147KFD1_THECS|nr:anthrone oxygenase family protein [Thermobifida cellulosilytica]KUP96004.1 hypothetical protein AC529_14445 [Thermobifida cellulosilytica TB100]
MVEVVRVGVVVASAVATGLLAGVFFAFWVAVMPGLAEAGDRVVVEVMQRINRAILTVPFLVVFLGSPLSAVAAVVLYVPVGGAVLGWLVAGAAGCVVASAVTVRGNVPLNDALAAAGPVERLSQEQAAGARRRFGARWVRWNAVRTAASTLAAGCLVAALAV